MSNLFGHLYAEDKVFRHDQLMRQKTRKRGLTQEMIGEESARIRSPVPLTNGPVLGSPFQTPVTAVARTTNTESVEDAIVIIPGTAQVPQPTVDGIVHASEKQAPLLDQVPRTPTADQRGADQQLVPDGDIVKNSFKTMLAPQEVRRAMRQEAYDAVLGRGAFSWDEVELISVKTHNDDCVL